MPSPPSALLLVALLSSACTTAPTRTIPEPLPEALEWAKPEAAKAHNFLGLKTRENDSGSLDALFFEPGVRVVRVIENSPAARAGFQVGDILLGWGDSEVDDPAALEALIQRSAADEALQAKVQRDDTVFVVPFSLRAVAAGGGGESEILYRRDPARSQAGWVTGRGGAVLVASRAKGPFPAAGVPVGSVVLELEGRDVLSARGLIRAMQALPAGSDVAVRFQRADGRTGAAQVELLDDGRVVTGAKIPILFNYTRDLERDSTEFALIDLYFISLFRYRRTGNEHECRFLRWIQFSSGAGELSE